MELKPLPYTRYRGKKELPFPLILSNEANMIPREDLQPGDTCHSTQLFYPSPDEVYEKACLGLSIKGTAALFDVDANTLSKHFPKTIARARAFRAAELTTRLALKAQDEMTKGDTSAIKYLLNRFDKEDVEPTVVIQQQFNIGEKATTLTIDDINNVLIK